LVKTGIDEVIWKELQRQIDSKGLTVKKGVIQDATFTTSDPGHKKQTLLVVKMLKQEEAKTENGQKR